MRDNDQLKGTKVKAISNFVMEGSHNLQSSSFLFVYKI